MIKKNIYVHINLIRLFCLSSFIEESEIFTNNPINYHNC